MSNDTTVTTTTVGGALGVMVVFVGNKFDAGVSAEVAAAVAVVYSAALGLVVTRKG